MKLFFLANPSIGIQAAGMIAREDTAGLVDLFTSQKIKPNDYIEALDHLIAGCRIGAALDEKKAEKVAEGISRMVEAQARKDAKTFARAFFKGFIADGYTPLHAVFFVNELMDQIVGGMRKKPKGG